MFENNINGNENKIKITQNNNDVKKVRVIEELIKGVIIAVVGGLILYFILGG